MIKNIVENNKNVDINKNKIDKLKDLFPNCFNSNGEFDISLFEEELKTNTNVIKEGYGLNFLGKNYAKYIASLDTETILVPDEENNSKEENKNSENIYISGDNIDALKHLVKSYSGQIKCIYIDPPYNTGNDGFVYNDKFNLSVEKLVDVLDINEEEAKRIYSMTNTKSNSHSAWLTFMYPRLYVAKQLLREDGVIFISIDDNEQSNLKLLCDNIFGEENIIANFIWTRKKKGSFLSNKVRKMSEYILCYGKKDESISLYGEDAYKDKLQPIVKRTNAVKNLLFPKNIISTTLKDGKYNRGYYGSEETGINILNDFNVEKGIIIDDLMVEAKFTWQQSFLDNELNNGTRVYLSNKFGFNVLRYNQKDKIKAPSTLINSDNEVGTNEDATIELQNLFNLPPNDIFNYAKPTSLIKYVINMVCKNCESAIILDFFSGSGTTADAVMQINAIENKNLKYILVQLTEECDKKSEAYKNGYKTIDEIGQERIRRAVKKIKEETNADIDYGFKHYTIKDVNTNTLDKLEKFKPNYVVSDGSILDEFGINAVLTTWMNEDGYGVTDVYEKLELEDYTAYKCQNTIYLLNWNISDSFIKALIEKYEKEENFDCNKIVMFGYSFTLTEIQTLKDNLQQVKNIKGINVEVITRY